MKDWYQTKFFNFILNTPFWREYIHRWHLIMSHVNFHLVRDPENVMHAKFQQHWAARIASFLKHNTKSKGKEANILLAESHSLSKQIHFKGTTFQYKQCIFYFNCYKCWSNIITSSSQGLGHKTLSHSSTNKILYSDVRTFSRSFISYST